MRAAPIVMVSSYPPRECGIATFCEEVREFIARANPDREVLVVSHLDGAGDGVFPIMDVRVPQWWKPVAEAINALEPHVVHLQHEYGLYEHVDAHGHGDANEGFLQLLEAIEFPTVVEPHTVHGRLREAEAGFLRRLFATTDLVLLKCAYQKWRLEWTFPGRGWRIPRNVIVVPHGARPDRRWGPEEIPALRQQLGVDEVPGLSRHIVGMIGWIQSNKRWDILLGMWEDVCAEIKRHTGEDWTLLAAGAMRDPNHESDYREWKAHAQLLEEKGIAHYYEFIPRGDLYYKMMAICDFVVLPSIDETQSGTLARIIALNKPFITTAPMEGLTSQTLESGGGLLFTNRQMLREKVIRLATDEKLRNTLGGKLRRYLDEVVSWELVARQYNEAYRIAREAWKTGEPATLPTEF
jgi:glycosyltransferase involved in cell wall biosynthesis